MYDQSQLVHVTLGRAPDWVAGQGRDVITGAFSDVTGGQVVIDDVRYHVTEENVVRRAW